MVQAPWALQLRELTAMLSWDTIIDVRTGISETNIFETARGR